MKAIITTLIRHQGVLPIKYEHWFQFLFKNKKAAIGLNKVTKGINVTDNENSLKNGQNCIELEHSLNKFTKGHIFKIEPDDTEDDNFKNLHLLWEPDNGREVFITETYFTDIFVFLEFDNFKEEIYNDDNLRIRYNKQILECLNLFIKKYNKVTRSGNLSHLENSESSKESFVLKQNYFVIDDDNTFEHYLQRGLELNMTATSLFIEPVGRSGIILNDHSSVNSMTEEMEKELLQNITLEEEFLSHALEQYTIKQNYKYAFLEAFLAIESSVEKFLEAKKIEANIPQKNIDDFRREVGIGYKINIELPIALLGNTPSNFNIMLNDLNTIRQKRNKIVHQGIGITAAEAYEAINKIYAFVTFLETKIKKEPTTV
nr:hypothetical protein [uncultured Chitinophaga sp.]